MKDKVKDYINEEIWNIKQKIIKITYILHFYFTKWQALKIDFLCEERELPNNYLKKKSR